MPYALTRRATTAWCTTALLQSWAWAWAGCEASKAQAPAVGDPATRDGCNHSWRMKGCGVAQRREFGSTAQRCAERRSHRGAARPRAALPLAGVIDAGQGLLAAFGPRADNAGMCFALFIGDHLARSVRGIPGAPPA
jgi:hypothetical protein